jgi:hypothetical protein
MLPSIRRQEMAFRLVEIQRLHDKAIALIAEHEFDTQRFAVYTNPGSEHNYAVGDLWPDLVVVLRSDNSIQLIAEVETSESVTEQESKQWLEYSNLGHPFVLHVPGGLCDRALRLCAARGVSIAELRWYSVVGGNLVGDCC